MPREARTCESLRLNLDEARAGRTWLILPDGLHTREAGQKYPLPTSNEELNKVAAIAVSPRRRDGGSIYIRRAQKRWRDRMSRPNRLSALDIEEQRILHNADTSNAKFKQRMREYVEEAKTAVQQVHQEASTAVASLTKLFELGRRTLEGQLNAHLNDEEWHGEKITAGAARQCFRMVSQAVKGLGLPSDQRQSAHAATMQEVAEAIKATQDVVTLAPGSGEEKPQ